IPDGKGEHAAQPIDAARSEILVKVDDRFRITGRLEDVATALQVAVEVLIVVNLAVEDDPDAPVLVRDRLEAIIEVDDAETAHADGDAVADVDTFIVGPTVRHDAAHGPDFVFTNRLSVPANYACDAAHGRISCQVRLKPDCTAINAPVESAFRRTTR